MKENGYFKVHIMYVIGILIAIIIELVAIKWESIPNLVNYITFALTISSLVLALLAIIYAVYSNSSFSQNIGLLNAVSDKILKTSEDLSRNTNELKKDLEQIPISLKNVETKTDKANEMLFELKTSEPKMMEPKKEELKSPDSLDEVWNNEVNVKTYLSTMSFNGKRLLYACSKSISEHKMFNLKEIFDDNEKYVYGILIASSSAKILSYSMTDNVINVYKMCEKMIKLIHDDIYLNAKKSDEKLSPENIEKYSWIKLIQKDEDYFSKI
jgi:hypothetical protein